jgi:integrase
MDASPYVIFSYSIRSPSTKETYFRRLRLFFDAVSINGSTFEDRCNLFAEKGKQDPNWAFNSILKYTLSQKERVERKEITAGTLRNCVKVVKTFCEITDVMIPWKKITRGLPRVKRYADDRAPTIEEIRKICEYPDRRIKAIVYTMISSGIRVGAWDYLKWGNIVPIKKNDCLVAAKMTVYSGEADEYFTFISREAFMALETWMEFRKKSGESISSDSWIMRNLWNSLRPEENSISKKLANNPEKLNSIGIKRLVERALWTQGLRSKLTNGKKRHEFQTDHGFRKWFKTQSEISGMKPINVEILMGHSVGLSDSYYRATERDLLEDYLKAVTDYLTINNEFKLQKKICELNDGSKLRFKELKSELYNKEQEIKIITQQDASYSDAIAGLSEQVIKLTQEIELLKNIGKNRNKEVPNQICTDNNHVESIPH